MSKIGRPDNLLHACPRLFSWTSRVLLKSSPRGFDTFCAWFKKVHPEGKSLLEAEVQLQENKNKLLVELIAERRFEILAKIQNMIEGTQLWSELKVIRTMVGSDRNTNSNRRALDWRNPAYGNGVDSES